ncbi:hypothetical protein SVIO_098640 [Streptomyces violaceusniger]|uniref:Orc1-like AAA ATPase domain-containing protein n=1 Tax=Streptomyces violaceusniger TaxID=68280 RepID=A0A4D4LCC4_STRVO|nr:hypothetical protein SVIO_098640 [Streptomyces violaceusniger]
MLHGLYWLAANLMTQGPLVLVLDDVHWCDERSLRWIDFLLRRADQLPLLVVLAQRSEEEPVAPAALADILAQPRSAVIRLDPLTDAEVAEMAHQVFSAPVAPSFAERAAAVCGGNPLTVTRLLRELRAKGVAPDESGIREIAEVGSYVVALSVRALFDARPDWVRDVATAIAVLGEEDAEHIGALAGVPATRVTDAVEQLREADVMAPDRADLAHDVVRSAVLEAAGEERLAELRARAALLLSDAGRPAEEVANQVLLVPGTPSRGWAGCSGRPPPRPSTAAPRRPPPAISTGSWRRSRTACRPMSRSPRRSRRSTPPRPSACSSGRSRWPPTSAPRRPSPCSSASPASPSSSHRPPYGCSARCSTNSRPSWGRTPIRATASCAPSSNRRC